MQGWRDSGSQTSHEKNRGKKHRSAILGREATVENAGETFRPNSALAITESAILESRQVAASLLARFGPAELSRFRI